MLPGTTEAKTGTYSHGNFGAIDADAADGVAPASFVARTVNVYFVPMVKPVTTHVSSPAFGEHVFDSGFDVTVYFEIARPPLSTGAVHDTCISPLPATIVGVPGADGATPAASVFAVDEAPDPAALVPATVIEYVVPAVRFSSLQERATDVHVTEVAPVAAAVAV
jgi:hypothetical protein